MRVRKADLKNFLDDKVLTYNNPEFIETDPIQIPHLYTGRDDIEISAFLSATIAWGQRKSILKNALKLMEWMDNSPGDFIKNFQEEDLKPFANFVHRTFNGDDCITFVHALKRIYREFGSLENCFLHCFKTEATLPGSGISNFKKEFFQTDHLPRTRKHISDPLKGSAAKRLNMFLRWMVRKDNAGVDFGIWQKFNQSQLYIPLDVHTGNVSRKLGLLTRKQSDWRAVMELTQNLRKFDAADPVKYDFALFGLGVFEKF